MARTEKKGKTRKLTPVSPKKLIKLFKELGYEESRRIDSHMILRHPDKVMVVAIPLESGRYIQPPIIMNLLKRSGLTRTRFYKLLDEL